MVKYYQLYLFIYTTVIIVDLFYGDFHHINEYCTDSEKLDNITQIANFKFLIPVMYLVVILMARLLK